MAAIGKIFKTVRTNWKKSVLLVCAAGYGANFGQKKYDEHLLRRKYCIEAKKYGDLPLRTGERVRKITVFLNPAARNGKCRKLFEKNVAPILYLAGLEVTVVKSQFEGQVKQFMSVLDPTDGIVIAGGNGTMLEVVTGMFRREDKVLEGTPIAPLPLGFKNTLCDSLVVKEDSEVKWLLETAMSIVQGYYTPADVLAISSEMGNVYAVSDLQWGHFKDAEERKLKNWYFGGLKHYWTYLRCALKTVWPPEFHASMAYKNPCEGCSKCYVPPVIPPWKWWHILIPPKQPSPRKDYSDVENADCGVEHAASFTGMEFSAKTRNHLINNKNVPDRAIDIEYDDGGMSRTEFVQEGWRRVKQDPEAHAANKKMAVQSFSFNPTEKEGKDWLSVDGENFEVVPLTVDLMPNKINLFYKPAQLSS